MRETVIQSACVFIGICALFVALNIPAIVWMKLHDHDRLLDRVTPPKPWFVRYAPMEIIANIITEPSHD